MSDSRSHVAGMTIEGRAAGMETPLFFLTTDAPPEY
jgi:hypothetical protein